MKPIVQLEHITKSYPMGNLSYIALNNISLNIEKGSYIAITGKSGSGKTTLLNMLAGIDRPTQGTIRAAGQEISNFSERQLTRWRGRNIGIVFQFFQLLPSISVLDNLMIAMDFVKVFPAAERRKRAWELLRSTDIDKHANKFPGELSGGEQQRVAISRALANNPDILIADEPTGNLDSGNTRIVNGIFAELNRQGKTVIIVTHEAVEKAGYGRIIQLSDGQIIAG
jgi:putative ABC transport system ATP-binding protein